MKTWCCLGSLRGVSLRPEPSKWKMQRARARETEREKTGGPRGGGRSALMISFQSLHQDMSLDIPTHVSFMWVLFLLCCLNQIEFSSTWNWVLNELLWKCYIPSFKKEIQQLHRDTLFTYHYHQKHKLLIAHVWTSCGIQVIHIHVYMCMCIYLHAC